eukprot:6997079-Prymnesium_polylepis.1
MSQTTRSSVPFSTSTLARYSVGRGAPHTGRRDFTRPEFIPSASTMWADPAGAMSRVLVV